MVTGAIHVAVVAHGGEAGGREYECDYTYESESVCHTTTVCTTCSQSNCIFSDDSNYTVGAGFGEEEIDKPSDQAEANNSFQMPSTWLRNSPVSIHPL
jgi:hypothetical protein